VLESVTIDSYVLGNGTEFTLARRGDEWVVRVNGSMILMSSLMHDSEESLAEHALSRVVGPRRVLVGGLGLGFTLRAVLDRVSRDCKVSVAELVPALVEVIKSSPNTFDAILLDVDNGPLALSNASNQRLYSERGVRACRDALRAPGVLAVWSAGPSARFERALNNAGFDVRVMRVAARKGKRARHVLFVAVARAPRSRPE